MRRNLKSRNIPVSGDIFMNSITPFFPERSRSDVWVMRASVGLNLVVMCFALLWLLRGYHASRAMWPHIVAGAIIGYFVADFASGLVHWGMDTWFSERTLGRAVRIAREHHAHPQHILGYGFLEFSTLGSAPSAIVLGPAAILTAVLPASPGTYIAMIIWLLTATCLFFGTHFHNLAHRPAGRIVRYAQRLHLIIPSRQHWAHHNERQLLRYCVINGWANHVCDTLHVWRGFELAIEMLTGIKPRRDDLEWQCAYRQTGTLPGTHTPVSAVACTQAECLRI